MLKTLRYFLINGVVVASIYLGMYNGDEGALNIALFLLWFTAISSLVLMSDTVIDEIADKITENSVPAWFDISLDTGVSLSLIYAGYFWLAGFYIFHMVLLLNARDKANKLISSRKG